MKIEKKLSIFFLGFFFLDSSETYAKNIPSKSEQTKFFCSDSGAIVLHTFQMILRKKNCLEKNVKEIFFFPFFCVRDFCPHTPHRGLRFQAPDAFRLSSPSQLVIGYHWLAILNSVRISEKFVSSKTLKLKCC